MNLAGLLLFGKYPQWKKPGFVVKAIAFYGNDPTSQTYRDSEDSGACIFCNQGIALPWDRHRHPPCLKYYPDNAFENDYENNLFRCIMQRREN